MSAFHHLWIDSLSLTVAMHCLSRLPFGVDSPYPDVLVEKSVIQLAFWTHCNRAVAWWVLNLNLPGKTFWMCLEKILSNRPFYHFLYCSGLWMAVQDFEWQWDCAWPCFDRDFLLLSFCKWSCSYADKLVFKWEKQRGLYQNKVF